MCGIIALRSKGSPVEPITLGRATSALAHRGPDGKGLWLSAGGSVGLGHTRLAVMDPDRGAQPISNEDGRRRIVANGEFYGFEAIRESLEGQGHRFRTRSDSEIALHLYEEMGVGCLTHLRGQFAFVIWDEDTETLFAARDRFGMKPLFYHESNLTLALASEAKALFAAGVTPRWDPVGVYHAMHACPDQSRSLFEGVAQVPPGHFMISTRAGTRIERYWDLPTPGDNDLSDRVDIGQHTGRIRELVEESVLVRTRADVPVGCLLSGGLDSSAVLGIAASGSNHPMRAFTVAFDQSAFDETVHAQEIARHTGACHEVVRASDGAVAAHFKDAVRHAEMVQYNAHGTARYLLSRQVHASGYRSVLAGEGADEVFFGYQFLQAAARMSARQNPLRWPRLLWRLARGKLGPRSGLAHASPWLARMISLMDGSPALLDRLSAGLDPLREMLSPDFLAGFEGFDIYRNYYQTCNIRAGISTWHPARQLIYLWLHSPFVNYHLGADRLDMAHGVEVRLPFLDHRLVEHTQQLPMRALADGTREKALLREAVKPYISAAVYRRDKQPFWAPASAQRAGTPLNDLVQDTLRGSGLAAVPFLDRAAVVRFLDTMPSMQAKQVGAMDSLLIALTSIAALQEAYRP